MVKLVGIFIDKKQVDLAGEDLKKCGFSVEIIKKSYIGKVGLPREIKPIYKTLMDEGRILMTVEGKGEIDGIREILENHGAEQIRTV